MLVNILHDEYLRSGDVVKNGGERCLCFTEPSGYFMRIDKSKYQLFSFKCYKGKYLIFVGNYADQVARG